VLKTYIVAELSLQFVVLLLQLDSEAGFHDTDVLLTLDFQCRAESLLFQRLLCHFMQQLVEESFLLQHLRKRVEQTCCLASSF